MDKDFLALQQKRLSKNEEQFMLQNMEQLVIKMNDLEASVSINKQNIQNNRQMLQNNANTIQSINDKIIKLEKFVYQQQDVAIQATLSRRFKGKTNKFLRLINIDRKKHGYVFEDPKYYTVEYCHPSGEIFRKSD